MATDANAARQYKVILVGHLSDTNLGDAAIVAGTARLMRRHQACVEVVPSIPAASLLPRDTAVCRKEGIRVHAPLCPLPVREVCPHRGVALVARTALAALRGAMVILVSRLSPRGASVFLARAERSTFAALQSADLIVLEGGSYLRAERRATHLAHVWRVLFPMLLALSLRKQVIGLGHSIGPIERGLPGLLLKWGLRRRWTIYVRDELSRQELEAITGRATPTVPDCSLGLANSSEASAVLSPSRLLGVSVRPLAQPERVQSALLDVIEALDLGGEPIVLIANAFGPSPKQDDGPVVAEFAQRLEERGYTTKVVSPCDPDAAIQSYRECGAILSVRMHAAILARIGGTPSIPLEYEGNKAAGVFSYLAPGLDISPADRPNVQKVSLLLRDYLSHGMSQVERDSVRQAAESLERVVADIMAGIRLVRAAA